MYDPEAQQFLADRFVTGTCPRCQHPEAYGDQCEACGSDLSANELIAPKSTLSGATPETRKTKHWYLPLDQYEGFISKWILEGHKNDWKPNVYGQVKSWVSNGLKPRAVTRDLDWGFPYLSTKPTAKYSTFGLMLPLAIFLLLKNGPHANKKIGNPIGRIQQPNWCILLEKTILFSLYYFSCNA